MLGSTNEKASPWDLESWHHIWVLLLGFSFINSFHHARLWLFYPVSISWGFSACGFWLNKNKFFFWCYTLEETWRKLFYTYSRLFLKDWTIKQWVHMDGLFKCSLMKIFLNLIMQFQNLEWYIFTVLNVTWNAEDWLIKEDVSRLSSRPGLCCDVG